MDKGICKIKSGGKKQKQSKRKGAEGWTSWKVDWTEQLENWVDWERKW